MPMDETQLQTNKFRMVFPIIMFRLFFWLKMNPYPYMLQDQKKNNEPVSKNVFSLSKRSLSAG